jgi:alanine racemase
MRPIQARIDPAALKHNLTTVRRYAPNSRVFSVIKANGYGHGMLRVAGALSGSDGFAVLTVSEGLALREAGFEHPILLLEGFFSEDELVPIAEKRLMPAIHCEAQLLALEQAWVPVKIDVFLKLNSGMNRLGFAPEAFQQALERIRACRNVGRVTLMTHFACADEEEGIAAQRAVFRSFAEEYQLPCSLANSAALIRFPEARADWVRPGIMLYGASPFADRTATEIGLKPVMTLESAIIDVQILQPGERVGYGGTFEAGEPMRIGTVACGYADGYPRHAGTGTPILVNGRRTRTLGRVSMDMLAVDLTGLDDAGIGSPVVLWGEGLPVEEVAAAAGTISYELLCAVMPRVPVLET